MCPLPSASRGAVPNGTVWEAFADRILAGPPLPSSYELSNVAWAMATVNFRHIPALKHLATQALTPRCRPGRLFPGGWVQKFCTHFSFDTPLPLLLLSLHGVLSEMKTLLEFKWHHSAATRVESSLLGETARYGLLTYLETRHVRSPAVGRQVPGGHTPRTFVRVVCFPQIQSTLSVP